MKKFLFLCTLFFVMSGLFSVNAQSLLWTPQNGDGVSFFKAENWVLSSTNQKPGTDIIGQRITIKNNIIVENSPSAIGGGSGVGAEIILSNTNMQIINSVLFLNQSKKNGIKSSSGTCLSLDNATCKTDYVDSIKVAMSGSSELILYGNQPLRKGSFIDFSSNGASVIFESLSKSEVEPLIPKYISVNSEPAIINKNIRVQQRGGGSVVIPWDELNSYELTLYSGYNFSKDSLLLRSGFYNGSLGSFENQTLSFKLKRGYMVTFAQNLNGTGVSKVYIATESDLAINLPGALQKSVSFIRVSPWSGALKKGIGAKGNDLIDSLNVSWFYDWGNADVSLQTREYVPMNWGGGATLNNMLELGKQMSFNHHLAFNEPDNADQSNMTVDNAIDKYELLLASGLRLGSPAVTDGAKGTIWLDGFMTKAIAKGLRIDFIAVHYYKRTTPVNFYKWLKAIYDEYHLPLWITEFNYGATWLADITLEQAKNGLKSYIEMLDTARIVERYAIFTWQPPSTLSLMSVRSPVTLNIAGEFYRDRISPLSYMQEHYSQGPNLGTDLNKHLNQHEILLYPNPSSGNFITLNHQSDRGAESAVIDFYSTDGSFVNSFPCDKSGVTNINSSQLTKGLYIYRYHSNNIVVTNKFVVK